MSILLTDRLRQRVGVELKNTNDCSRSRSVCLRRSVPDRRNQPEQARTLWQEALSYLHPSSSAFQTVQQWLENLSKPRKVNYLLPFAVGCSILFCLIKNYWLLAIFCVAIILFCFRRSIFHRN